jgi:endonuclease/exonuclease/phosphatase family metal-dependent hydrolase
MRVITWNLGLADRSRRFVKTHDAAWRYLMSMAPDLAFLQEALPPSWAETEGRVVRDPFRRWGSLIFSRTLAIEPYALPEDSPLRALPNYLAFAEVPMPDGRPAIAASIHAPPRPAAREVIGDRDPLELRRSVEGPKYNDAIFAALVPLVEGHRFIVAGDWNTARHQRTPRESKAGQEFFLRVSQARWHDCVWGKLQGEIRTWFGPGRILQDDYVFCDLSLADSVHEVTVAEEAARREHLSDHAPLIVDFDLLPSIIGDPPD